MTGEGTPSQIRTAKMRVLTLASGVLVIASTSCLLTNSLDGYDSGWGRSASAPDGGQAIVLDAQAEEDAGPDAQGDADASPQATTRLEAEDGVTSGNGVSVRTDVAGYEGAGFVGSFTVNGDKLTLTYPNVVAGTYTLRVRYHAWTDQHNDVLINGATHDLAFPATGSDWAVATISGVTLPSGTTNITLVKNWGYVDIDWMELARTS
jgi:hypothetical protein